MLLALAKRRARRRAESAGAALFIVAITLALLAAMGVYGLTATARDIQASGDARVNTQLQHAALGAFMASAETIVSSGTQGTSTGIVQAMTSGTYGNATGGQSNAPPFSATACRSAKPYTGNINFVNQEACTILDMPRMTSLVAGLNPLTVPPTGAYCANCDQLSSDSLGGVVQIPSFSVEVTNPRPISCASFAVGNDNKQQICKELTLTVYMNALPAPGLAPSNSVVGRGRLRVVVDPSAHQ